MKKTVIVIPILFCSIMAIMLGCYFNTLPAIGAPITEWEKAFGGPDRDDGNSVRQTTDGGFIIAGDTLSYGAGSFDIYLIKTDADGNEIWAKTISNYHTGSSFLQTTDGGFIIAGSTAYPIRVKDVYLLKTDANGNEIWSKRFSIYNDNSHYDKNNKDVAASVQQTTDGGYIIAGNTRFPPGEGHEKFETEAYIIKTDADGNEIWSKTFGRGDNEYAFSILQTTDGSFIIAGRVDKGSGLMGYHSLYAYLMKIDADGNEIWLKKLSVFSHSSVQQTTDGGFIIAGGGNLVKTDANGNEIWVKDLDNELLSGVDMKSVQQTTDGGYIMTGFALVQNTGFSGLDVCLIKVAGTAAEDCATYDITTERIHIPLLDAGQLGKFEVILGPPHNVLSADTVSGECEDASYNPSTEGVHMPTVDAWELGMFNCTLAPPYNIVSLISK